MKMADIFDLPLSGDSGFIEDMTGDITEYREFGSDYIHMSQAAAFAVNNHDKLVEALKEVQEFFETNAFRMDNLLDMHVRESVDDALKELDQ